VPEPAPHATIPRQKRIEPLKPPALPRAACINFTSQSVQTSLQPPPFGHPPPSIHASRAARYSCSQATTVGQQPANECAMHVHLAPMQGPTDSPRRFCHHLNNCTSCLDQPPAACRPSGHRAPPSLAPLTARVCVAVAAGLGDQPQCTTTRMNDDVVLERTKIS